MARLVASGRQLASGRQTLNENYSISAGTTFEEFEAIGDWVFSGAGGSSSIDTTIKKSGTGSLKITSNNATAYTATKVINTARFSNYRTLTFWVYIEDVTKMTQSGSTCIYISSSTTLATYYSWTFNVSRFRNGWNKVIIDKSEFSTSNGESWGNTMVRIRFRFVSASGQLGTVYLDNMVIDEYNRPNIILTFDDGRVSQYTEGYNYMSTKELPGTLYLSGGNLDLSESYVSTANCQEMYDSGWDISLHGGVDLTTLTTKEEMLAELESNLQTLNKNGWSRNNCQLHYAYPKGGYNDTSDEALNELGILTGRTILTDTPHGLTSMPVDNYARLKCGYITNATTLSTVLARVDSAIAHGQTLILVFHSLVASPSVSTEWAISNFQALVDYVYMKQLTGQADVLTISEWYSGIQGNRKLATTRTAV